MKYKDDKEHVTGMLEYSTIKMFALFIVIPFTIAYIALIIYLIIDADRSAVMDILTSDLITIVFTMIFVPCFILLTAILFLKSKNIYISDYGLHYSKNKIAWGQIDKIYFIRYWYPSFLWIKYNIGGKNKSIINLLPHIDTVKTKNKIVKRMNNAKKQ